ncbi:hypothetical protein AYI69_g6769 [Smittium culicis]|uniref:Uncharacterized protein n=1 Tax=Smittium culicis TaxID=133412 RepID=A0A1R1XWV4_9FUNG|nr:hypothetical protein AYI69_g6769 [Smittium culicis]
MGKFQSPIRMPTVESDITDHTESPQRMSHDDISEADVEICDLFSGPDVSHCIYAHPTRSNGCSPRPEKRITTAIGKQALTSNRQISSAEFAQRVGPVIKT